jgi:hypothetical protein
MILNRSLGGSSTTRYEKTAQHHQSVRQVLSRVPQLRDLVELLEGVLERAQNLAASRWRHNEPITSVTPQEPQGIASTLSTEVDQGNDTVMIRGGRGRLRSGGVQD